MGFPLYFIDENLLIRPYLSARDAGNETISLFQPPQWREARDRNGIYPPLCVYVCMHVYICTYIHTCIYAVFFNE